MSGRLLSPRNSVGSYLHAIHARARWRRISVSIDSVVRSTIRVVALLLFILLSGCSRTLHLEIPSGIPVKLVTSYEDSETGIVHSKEVLLQPDTSEYRLLQQWLTRNQQGWSQSLATNPNGGIIVHAGDLSLQFVDDAVFTWTDKGQFQKRIPQEDYAFLKQAGKKS